MVKDLKKLKNEDLVKELQSARKKIQEFRFSVSGAGSKNVKEGRDLKKSIARMLTEMRTRQNQKNK